MSTPEPTPLALPAAAEGGELAESEWCPIYKWGQYSRKVVVTVFVPCLDEGKVKTTIKPRSVTFRAERVAAFAGGKESKRVYTLHLELSHQVDEKESKAYLRHDHVRLELIKKETRTWETLQPPHVPKNANERPDFDLLDGGDGEDTDEKFCREKPRGRYRARSEREMYNDFRMWVGKARKRSLKRLRFFLRDLDLRRENAGLTGSVLYALLLSSAMLAFSAVRYLFGVLIQSSQVCPL